MSKRLAAYGRTTRLLRDVVAVAAVACATLSTLPPVFADEGDDASPDGSLLEDLGAGLFDDNPADAELDEELTRKSVPPDGKGVGAGQGGGHQSNWLQRVTDRMRKVESALAARDASGRASATQQEIVRELDAMIAKLQKQCEQCGGQCEKPGGPQNKPSKSGGRSGAQPGETTAAAATETGAPADRAAIGNLVKDLWGRLPERQREELLQPLSEDFLPEYAAEIEEYFRALAETPADPTAETQP